MIYEQFVDEARVLSDPTRRSDACVLARMFLTEHLEEDLYWAREARHGRVKWESSFRLDGTRVTEMSHVGEYVGRIEHWADEA